MTKIHLLIDGLLVGSAIFEAFVIYRIRKPCGILKIDRKSDDKDLYRFEIDNLDSLSNKKYVGLKVDNNADLSHN